MGYNKNILLCPLDWGLGHTTRCIPIVHKLIENNFNVFIAGNNNIQNIVLNEIPQVKFIFLKGYNIFYSKSLPLSLVLIFQLPKIIFKIIREHQQLKKIIKKHNIEVVISDNRFGLWNNNIKCVYITHQIMIKCPKRLIVFEKVLYKIHNWFISKYSECWIPDFKNMPNLSGDLSHKFPPEKKTIYIGPLSRVSDTIKDEKIDFDVLFLLSGPEPQRTVFENIIIRDILNTKLKIAIIRGTTRSDTKLNISPHYIINYADNKELENLLKRSRLIISRSGYSTIMDLASFGKNAVFVPTPGQTEQEYLAEYFFKNGVCYYMSQHQFSIEKAVAEAENFLGLRAINNYDILTERICLL